MIERVLRVHPNGECRELRHLLGPDIPDRSFFEEYRPYPAMYYRPEAALGIHGEGHSTRVNVNGQLLAGILNRLYGTEVDRAIIGQFAKTHDLMRQNDAHDPGHGERAAVAVRSVYGLVPERLVPAVAHLDHWHVPQDWEAPMTPTLAVVKEGDGLDRFRELDPEKGAFNPAFLRFEVSKDLLVRSARLLYQLSTEIERVYGLSPFDAAMEAGIMMGIIANK